MKISLFASVALCLVLVGCSNSDGSHKTTTPAGITITGAPLGFNGPVASFPPLHPSPAPTTPAHATTPTSSIRSTVQLPNVTPTTPTTPALTSPTPTKVTPTAPTTPTVTTPTAPTTTSTCLTSSPSDPFLASALKLINDSRAANGAGPVQLDQCNDTCAARHSQDLFGCAGNNLQNLGSTGTNPTGCAHQDFAHGDTCGASAENQGVSELTDNTAAFTQMHDQMMQEGPPAPGQINHFGNIVNPSWTKVAIGIFRDPAQGWLWVTEDFAP